MVKRAIIGQIAIAFKKAFLTCVSEHIGDDCGTFAIIIYNLSLGQSNSEKNQTIIPTIHKLKEQRKN